MSDRAQLSRTRFEGVHDGVSWGWRMSNDEFRSYTDGCEDDEVPVEPLELLAKAVAEAPSEESEFFEGLLTYERGLSINGSWYTFEQIAPVLQRVLLGEECEADEG